MKILCETAKQVMREAELPLRRAKGHLQTAQISFAKTFRRHANDENAFADG
jgi:hypothetical protein